MRKASGKGSKVYVEGRLRTRRWEDGRGQTRSRTEVVADELVMLDRRGGTTETEVEVSAAEEIPF